MKISVTATRSFAASHQVPGDSFCGRLHGHTWTVAITVEGGINPKTGSVVHHGELVASLRALCSEFERDDLNAMAPSIIPTPEGFAFYVREQLILAYPGLTKVRVDMDDISATVEIERR